MTNAAAASGEQFMIKAEFNISSDADLSSESSSLLTDTQLTYLYLVTGIHLRGEYCLNCLQSRGFMHRRCWKACPDPCPACPLLRQHPGEACPRMRNLMGKRFNAWWKERTVGCAPPPSSEYGSKSPGLGEYRSLKRRRKNGRRQSSRSLQRCRKKERSQSSRSPSPEEILQKDGEDCVRIAEFVKRHDRVNVVLESRFGRRGVATALDWIEVDEGEWEDFVMGDV
ncbi:hypothetical protein K458DRAFT_470809 [Lentithecium fluviatile CBS 122367]|uniref:Uncharacterized protein n=1 Tax=Lentithecium fluviatile CBS 122367 TaxID=1168545 RepID=A0A6G1J8K1_9PLEO|nr:hypothetical protein K458DRAFT_470809 [Lentithecium fluviatile CBS 122367]